MKHFFFAIFTLPFISSFSQNTDQETNKERKWEISLQANTVDKLPSVAGLFIPDEKYIWGSEKNKSYSMGLTATCFLKENLSFRIKFDYLNRRIVERSGDPSYDTITTGGNLTSKAEITEKNLYLSPGLQWNVSYKKTNVYYGFQLPLNGYGKINISYREEARGNNILSDAVDATVNIPGGYSFGIGSFWGMGVNISKRVSISTELSCDYLIYSVIAKGKTEFHQVFYYYYPAGPPTTISNSADNTTDQFGVLSLKGSIKLSFSF